MLVTSQALDVDAAQNQALLSLRQVLREHAFCIFIDPTLADPLALDGALADAYLPLKDQGKASKQRLPYIHDNFDPAVQPYVLHISNQVDAERLVSTSLRLACEEASAQHTPDARTVCGWLVTDRGALDVAHWLAAQAKLIRPDNEAWYLRFWDPRVIWHLPRVLAPAHLARLQPALSAWHFVDASLQLRCAMPLGGRAPSAQSVPLATPNGALFEPVQHLDAATWLRLQRIEAVNRVYAAFADAPLAPNDETAHRIEHQLERSAASGFAGIDDAVTFACAAMASHPRFSEHPAVAAALAASPSVAAAFGDFDDTFWAKLREGSWLEQPAFRASAP
ncbi:MAG: DUF4123 domain-containing protein [Burkholderiales bacterium]|jgi:hypothetical protein